MVKAKIKDAKSQEEAESLKFTQKNIINKVLTEWLPHTIRVALFVWKFVAIS